jgi:hypothetical protein
MKVAGCCVICLIWLWTTEFYRKMIPKKKPVSKETGFETLFPVLCENILFGKTALWISIGIWLNSAPNNYSKHLVGRTAQIPENRDLGRGIILLYFVSNVFQLTSK